MTAVTKGLNKAVWKDAIDFIHSNNKEILVLVPSLFFIVIREFCQQDSKEPISEAFSLGVGALSVSPSKVEIR